MKKKLLLIALITPFYLSAQTIIVSENFDSYADADLLSTVGTANGWSSWAGAAGASAVVSSAYSVSPSNSGRSVSNGTYDSDALWTWTDLTAGRYSISMQLMIPAGSTGGYIGIGNSNMDNGGTQPNAVYIMGDSLILMADAANYFAQGALTPDTWIPIEIIIDIDNGTSELLVGGISAGVGSTTFSSTSGLGGLDLWGYNVDVTQSGVYNPGDYYYDDLVVTDITGVGIKNPYNNMDLNIYPNPVVENVFISASNLSAGVYTLEILDINGKIISSEKVYISGELTKEIFTSFKAGVYTLSLHNEHSITTKKFVVK